MNKSNTDILETYGSVMFNDHFDHNTVECRWAGSAWSRSGYGRTREEAAGIALGAVSYIIHHTMRVVEAE
jgi:hypothetical protein